ncbi:type II toxin-antitoxin system HicB family antitoxin [Candidatus Peregrinibacteria bacterium]|nr:type II toxin-antitoxin system HicB family antitoxin [Candidatus Peregrinibacteria bacterium]
MPQEEGGFTVEIPDLPGCISEGDTLEEAETNIQEAVELYLETLEERGIPLPEREPLKVLKMNITIVRGDQVKETYA